MKGASKGKELKRLAPQRLSRITGVMPIKAKRMPLAFVQDEPDPLVGMGVGKTNIDTVNKEVDAIGVAFRAAAKKSKKEELHELAGYGADYAVLVFHDADQVTAFFKAIGYQAPKDIFIDGTIIADILKIDLPEPKVQMKEIKRVHNPKLTRLAQPR